MPLVRKRTAPTDGGRRARELVISPGPVMRGVAGTAAPKQHEAQLLHWPERW